jgi:hypothetical protein
MSEDDSGYSARCTQATLEVNFLHEGMKVASYLLRADRVEDLCVTETTAMVAK